MWMQYERKINADGYTQAGQKQIQNHTGAARNKVMSKTELMKISKFRSHYGPNKECQYQYDKPNYNC